MHKGGEQEEGAGWEGGNILSEAKEGQLF